LLMETVASELGEAWHTERQASIDDLDVTVLEGVIHHCLILLYRD
jgi:hypothetical protein